MTEKLMTNTTEITERNEAGQMTYSRTSYGYEVWYRYDADGNVTHYRDSDGYEVWFQHDENGKLTYYRSSDGYKYWF